MRNRLFFLIAALCLALSQSHSYAQKYIYGDVHDWLTNALMENVKAVLMTSDSVVIDSMYTGWKGQVDETKKPGYLRLKTSLLHISLNFLSTIIKHSISGLILIQEAVCNITITAL